MRQYRAYYLGTLFLLMPLFADAVFAEIYKWVDADGNVHFGDKPQDTTLARDAETVTITEGYKPPERSEEEQAAFEREQQIKREKTQRKLEYQQTLKAADKEEAAKRRQEKEAVCNRYAENIARLTTMDVSSGIPTYTYIEGEDGKSVSSARQREIIQQLREESAAAGCS